MVNLADTLMINTVADGAMNLLRNIVSFEPMSNVFDFLSWGL